jgi:hypothetical protein
VDPLVHKRFLEYRDLHEYFGKKIPKLDAEAFVKADAEQRALHAKGEKGRDDEEEARYEELSKVLLRD